MFFYHTIVKFNSNDYSANNPSGAFLIDVGTDVHHAVENPNPVTIQWMNNIGDIDADGINAHCHSSSVIFNKIII